ncbi:hypothetical protein [Pseudomonas sp. 24 E 13]|nr:hypothetical protein [Pseudomonas sp. 24 E 13]CRM98684.1 hypothetical protein [Pseudomonas sp. 34 E 7]
MLAKNVNDTACFLNERGACEFFASKLAPTTSKPLELRCSQVRKWVNGSSVLLSTWFSTKLERTLVTPSIRVRCPSSSF